MDDEHTLYAAGDAQEAASLYACDTFELVKFEDGYPRELTEKELDEQRPDIDENEQPTGGTTTIRAWLELASCSGPLAYGL
jgi:hypothetical protein